MSPARWWHVVDHDANRALPPAQRKVVCTLCPRRCHIPAGQRGFCFVRANHEGQLVLTTYGRSSGFCIDPIEKKPLFHFLPGSAILSLGTAGCNLGCKFCQNWDISKSRAMDTLAEQATPQAIAVAAARTGCTSIAFTYNDPVIWAEYAIDIAQAAHAMGLKTVAVTAGYMSPDPRQEFYEHIDAANVDLKAFTETFYRKYTQTALKPVLDTLVYLAHETSVWVEITTLLIPGCNDSPGELRAMCAWIVRELGPNVPLHLTAFHPDYQMMDQPPTPPATLVMARQIALDAGVRFAYVGNVHDPQRESTYCPQCHALLIERDWYELRTYRVQVEGEPTAAGNPGGGRCPACQTPIPGLFTPLPGAWGRKRVPLRIASG
jgi:pyruvate formate lyase activating enzyme